MAERRTAPDGLGRRLLSLYRSAPLADRVHVRVRWATCPFRAVAAELPRAGSVLEVGCGHGLLSNYLALASPTAARWTPMPSSSSSSSQRATLG